MPSITEKKKAATPTEESLKEWARRMAADAPPLSDDQFHQLHTVFMVGNGRKVREPAREAA